MKQLKFTALNLKKINLIVAIVALSSCAPDAPIVVRSSDFQNSVDQVTRIMVHDIFSPPVASRIYAYPNIAAYEILAQSDKAMGSLTGSVKHLKPIPLAKDSTVNLELAALIAHMDLSKSLVFSEELLAGPPSAITTGRFFYGTRNAAGALFQSATSPASLPTAENIGQNATSITITAGNRTDYESLFQNIPSGQSLYFVDSTYTDPFPAVGGQILDSSVNMYLVVSYDTGTIL